MQVVTVFWSAVCVARLVFLFRLADSSSGLGLGLLRAIQKVLAAVIVPDNIGVVEALCRILFGV